MTHSLFLTALLVLAATAGASEPIVIADFEATDYGQWQVSGNAFGDGPARGTLPGQMPVEGFLGKGVVNSFNGGDDATGRLSSPPFKIERKFITFLIGGGGWATETCMNLLVDGKVVRTAAGPNTKAGGTEQLAPAAWDLTEFAGRQATLEIVDERKGTWGHINVDQIVLTDDRGSAPLAVAPKPVGKEVVRRLRIDADFLQLPLMKRDKGADPGVERFTLEEQGKVMRFLHLQIAARDQKTDFMYSYDVREFRGREVTFRFKSTDADVLQRLQLSDKQIIDPTAYDGPHRPRFHFSPRIGWMNDINGSYHRDGLYHIFYQANPTTAGRSPGFDMHWGHSVSKDLVHWEEWPIALFPDGAGECYSGTALMIEQRIPGLNDKAPLPTPALLFAATAPFSQHLAMTVDGGRTWRRFAGNPVVPNIGEGDRDPKVIWHEASQHYVMVLYVGGKGYVILRSKNLTQWAQMSVLPNWFECPEFIPVKSPTSGEDLWLLYGSYRSPKDAKDGFSDSSAYQLGRFDGKTFTPIAPPRRAHQGPNFYAALTFVNEPKGRPVMMSWASGPSSPGEPFNQCASLPLLLSLKAIAGADKLCFEPVEEISVLRGKPLIQLNQCTTADANSKLQALAKDATLDVTLTLRPAERGNVKVTIRRHQFACDFTEGRLICSADGKPISRTTLHADGTLDARFLIDRGIIETFWNHGEAAYSAASLATDPGPAIAVEGNATVEELTVYPMNNIWK